MLTATAVPWSGGLVHERYGTDDTYRMAAGWLEGCYEVADWGGGSGYFRKFLPASVRYTVIDGTKHNEQTMVADLAAYTEPADGILLRHVLEHNDQWRTVLANALHACRYRLVVVTFTPDTDVTHRMKMKSGWPVWAFATAELRTELGVFLVHDQPVQTSHPEHVYYVERWC